MSLNVGCCSAVDSFPFASERCSCMCASNNKKKSLISHIRAFIIIFRNINSRHHLRFGGGVSGNGKGNKKLSTASLVAHSMCCYNPTNSTSSSEIPERQKSFLHTISRSKNNFIKRNFAATFFFHHVLLVAILHSGHIRQPRFKRHKALLTTTRSR